MSQKEVGAEEENNRHGLFRANLRGKAIQLVYAPTSRIQRIPWQ